MTPEAAATESTQVAPEVETARKQWDMVMALHTSSPQFEFILQSLISSVVIDLIQNNMQTNDEFARAIGRRITHLMDAMNPRSQRRGKVARTS